MPISRIEMAKQRRSVLHIGTAHESIAWPVTFREGPTMWEKFVKRVRIEGKKPVPSTAVTQFEKSHNVRLPTSYRKLVEDYGPGILSEYVRIYAPIDGVSMDDLERFVKLIRKVSDTLIETYGNAPLIKRMLPFADTVGGDVI